MGNVVWHVVRWCLGILVPFFLIAGVTIVGAYTGSDWLKARVEASCALHGKIVDCVLIQKETCRDLYGEWNAHVTCKNGVVLTQRMGTFLTGRGRSFRKVELAQFPDAATCDAPESVETEYLETTVDGMSIGLCGWGDDDSGD